MNPIAPVRFLGREIGPGKPVFVIAEIGLNHNGELDIAKKLIDAAKAAGCDAVKFQKRDVANLAVGSVLDAADSRFPAFGATYRAIREHMEFDKAEFQELIAHARAAGLPFFCTPFDVPSFEFLEDLGMEAYKLASHSLTNLPFLEHAAARKKPCILSTGMALPEEVDRAVDVFKKAGCPLILLHCVSSYPTPYEHANLRVMDALAQRYALPVGYSGHEVGTLATIAAVSRGACVVERHITLDTKMMGFDHKLSIDPVQLKQVVADIRAVEIMLGDGVKRLLPVEQITRDKYHVSWVSKTAIKAGTVVTAEMLTLKNPGTGIPAWKKDQVVGCKAKTDIPADALLEPAMLEAPPAPRTPAAPRVLAIVLARGGSKSVPKKNIRPLNGLPTIAYTIREALKCPRITRLIVSTESEEIAAVARQHGAEVPFLRPAHLATDTATSKDGLQHATAFAEKEEGKPYDYVVELMCTNPLKTAADIDGCLDKLLSTGADSVIGVVQLFDHHPARIKRIVDDRITDFCVPEPLDARRQDLKPDAFIRNGSIYAMRRDVLMIQDKRYGTADSRPYYFPPERSVNIDSEEDWFVAEQRLRRAAPPEPHAQKA
ncbi:MAG: N-acetylneuraminate synthase family protein [Elusimicrobiota bacterium]|nr:N-acetylneuraminate synthase family protein [Elusimicrobiota bacterium]